MCRLNVRYRPEALADLEEIYRFILKRSNDPATAFGFVKRIQARCRSIGIMPKSGRPRDDLDSGLRTIAFERSAVIAYLVEADAVRITNVFYGGRDYESLYRDRGEEAVTEEVKDHE